MKTFTSLLCATIFTIPVFAQQAATAQPYKKVNPQAEAVRSHLMAPTITADPPAGERYDTLLLTKITESRDSRVTEVTTYSYDEYGRRSLVESKDDDDEVRSAKRYTYTVGADNVWTSRIIETMNHEGTYVPTSKEEREVDAWHRVLTRKEYTYSYDDNGLWLYRTTTYDYNHPVYDADGHAAYGHAARVVVYDQGGMQVKLSEYTWMESAHQYIQTLSLSQDEWTAEKVEAVPIDNGARFTTYRREGNDGAWVKMEESEQYYIVYAPGIIIDGGNIKTYYSDGEAGTPYGQKITFAANTPSAGWEQWTTYTANDGVLVPDYRTEKYDMPLNGGISSITGNKGIMRGYNSSDNATFPDTPAYIYTYDRVKDKLWHITFENLAYNSSSSYYAIEMGKDVTTGVDNCYLTGTDSGFIYTNDDDEYRGIILYFDANGLTGQEGRILNTTPKVPFYTNLGLSNLLWSANSSYPLIYQQDSEGNWKPLSSYEWTKEGWTIAYKTGQIREHYDINADGTLAGYSIYNTIDGKEYEVGRGEFTYSDKQVVGKKYSTTSINKEPSLKESIEVSLLDDGTVRYSDYEYNENGKIDYARRTDYNKGVTTSYEYDEDTQELTAQEPYYSTSYSVTDANGMTTSYEVEYDSNHREVPVSKVENISTNSLQMHASYHYDTQKGKWIGDEKYERYTITLPFRYIPYIETSRENVYDDEYFHEAGANVGNTYSPYREEVTIEHTEQYTWNETTGQWVKNNNGKEFSYSMPDAQHLSFVNANMGGDDLISRTLETDAQGHLLLEENTTSNTNEEGTETRTERNTYAYNDYGWLTNRTLRTTYSYRDGSEGGSVYTWDYEFSTLSIYPTSIDEAQATAMQLTVTGRTINVPGGTTISLYDTAGRLVGQGKTSLTAPTSGLYIIKTSVGNCKVILK